MVVGVSDDASSPAMRPGLCMVVPQWEKNPRPQQVVYQLEGFGLLSKLSGGGCVGRTVCIHCWEGTHHKTLRAFNMV